MNLKLSVVLVLLPMGLSSVLTKSVSAAEVHHHSDRQPIVVIDQRDARHIHDGRYPVYRGNTRHSNVRWVQPQRVEIRYDANRYNTREVWIPGHYELGFLGLTRFWVEGHWETQRY